MSPLLVVPCVSMAEKMHALFCHVLPTSKNSVSCTNVSVSRPNIKQMRVCKPIYSQVFVGRHGSMRPSAINHLPDKPGSTDEFLDRLLGPRPAVDATSSLPQAQCDNKASAVSTQAVAHADPCAAEARKISQSAAKASQQPRLRGNALTAACPALAPHQLKATARAWSLMVCTHLCRSSALCLSDALSCIWMVCFCALGKAR